MKEYKLKINGNDYAVTINSIEESIADMEVNGTPFKVEIDKPIKSTSPISAPVSRVAAPSAAAPVAAAVSKPVAASGAGTIIDAPLPGVILEVSVKEGDAVKKGQKLMILEAMKMENVIEASCDGSVTSIKANKGDSVLEGAPLIIIG